MKLSELKKGQTAKVTAVGGENPLHQRLLDMGIIPGEKVTLLKFAPMGDPMEVRIHGYELSLRLAEAEHIGITPHYEHHNDTDINAFVSQRMLANHADHPGYGEEGRFHDARNATALPDDKVLGFVLAGNQNCGKTTLFNQLTGRNEHVGNFPGITIDHTEASIRRRPNTLVTDLPGIFSLSPCTGEEQLALHHILTRRPDCIINVVDASNIERNLYLTMQLMELEIPMVLALNMMDEVKGNHGTIRVNMLESLLGIPVIPVSAVKNEGIGELVQHAMHVARYQEKPVHTDFCSPLTHGGAVHRCLHGIMHLVEDHCREAGLPVRYAASKLAEGDPGVAAQLHLSQNEREMLGHITAQLQEERGLDAAAAMADMRYAYIRAVWRQTVVKPHLTKERQRSALIDKALTGKYTALPSFVAIMALTFWLSFDAIGGTAQGWLERVIASLTASVDATLHSWAVEEAVRSLVVNGIIGGVGVVVTFVPLIITLFFCLSLLEDSGYMARIAFVMDKMLRKIGLSGRSIVPLLLGFGCSVPSIMASRSLPSQRDRKLTIMLIPFMSCTAKLPIYAFFSAIFFPRHAALVMGSLYLIGIAVGVACTVAFKHTAWTTNAMPFVMELPTYRLPVAKNVAHLLWDKARDFLQEAFTVIFLASLVIWALQTFDFRLHVVTDSSTSILACIASYVAHVFEPLQLGDWRIVTTLVSGFMRKESVVSTLAVLYPGTEAVRQAFTHATAYAFLVFCLLYTPCAASITCVRRELGTRSAVFMVIWQCLVAWACAYAAKLLFELLIG